MRTYASMSSALADAHGLLWADVALLHQRWTTFKRLYTDQPTVDLLNWAAGGFFQLLQRVFLDDLLLGIARLADPPETKQQTNLVLRSLLVRLPDDQSDLFGELSEKIETFEAKAAFARPVRNKRLAHRDEGIASGASDRLNYRYTNEDIDGALGAAADILNHLDLAFEGRTTMFAEFIHTKGADVLLRRLQAAKDANDEYFRDLRAES